MLDFLWYCVLIIFGTVGIFVVCGGVVSLCNTAFCRLGGGFLSRLLSIIGTPIHELGHLIMCLIFAHKVEQVCLWKPSGADGVSGYVQHSYNRKNPYKMLGNLFIGLGPIVSGLLVVMLTVRLAFPTAYAGYVSSSLSSTTIWGSFASGCKALFTMLRSLGAGGGHAVTGSLALIFIVSVCLHITLSPSDVRSCFRSLPIYLLLVLAVAAITYLFKVQGAVQSALMGFFFMSLRLFMIIICVEVTLVLVGLIIFTVKKIFIH